MPQFILRFNLNDDTGSFNELAEALRRETEVTIVRLDQEQWLISASGIERPVTVLFRGENEALKAVRLWLDRLQVRDIVLVASDVAAQMVFSNGVQSRKQGANEIALECFDRVLAIDESLGPAWSNRANILAEFRQWEKAEDSYRRAIDCSPTDVLAHFNFGTFLIKRGRYKEASTELHEALRLDPEFEQAKRNLEIAESMLPPM